MGAHLPKRLLRTSFLGRSNHMPIVEVTDEGGGKCPIRSKAEDPRSTGIIIRRPRKVQNNTVTTKALSGASGRPTQNSKAR